jgi:hypothetical protein
MKIAAAHAGRFDLQNYFTRSGRGLFEIPQLYLSAPGENDALHAILLELPASADSISRILRVRGRWSCDVRVIFITISTSGKPVSVESIATGPTKDSNTPFRHTGWSAEYGG